MEARIVQQTAAEQKSRPLFAAIFFCCLRFSLSTNLFKKYKFDASANCIRRKRDKRMETGRFACCRQVVGGNLRADVKDMDAAHVARVADAEMAGSLSPWTEKRFGASLASLATRSAILVEGWASRAIVWSNLHERSGCCCILHTVCLDCFSGLELLAISRSFQLSVHLAVSPEALQIAKSKSLFIVKCRHSFMKSSVHLLLAIFYVFALGFIGIYASTLMTSSSWQADSQAIQPLEFQWGECAFSPSSISRIEAN